MSTATVSPKPVSPINPHFFPIAVGLLSFWLNWSLMSKGPYHLDCLDLVIKADDRVLNGHIRPLYGPGYPLTVFMAALFHFIARLFSIQDPALAVNFMSVVFGALS